MIVLPVNTPEVEVRAMVIRACWPASAFASIARGVSDDAVLQIAVVEDRILVTLGAWPADQSVRASFTGVRPIEARYEDGVLKPTRSVPLRPGERVRLIVLRQPDAKRWNLARLASASVEDAELAGQGLAEWANRLDSEEHD